MSNKIKTALVTGANSGIGFEAAAQLAQYPVEAYAANKLAIRKDAINRIQARLEEGGA